jgi:hypothetical protein
MEAIRQSAHSYTLEPACTEDLVIQGAELPPPPDEEGRREALLVAVDPTRHVEPQEYSSDQPAKPAATP